MKSQERLLRDILVLNAIYDEHDDDLNTITKHVTVRGNPPTEIEIDNFRIPQQIAKQGGRRPDEIRVKIPVPPNIYQPVDGDRFVFYSSIFLEPGLRLKKNGSLRSIPRYYENPGELWAWLCLKMETICGKEDTIATYLANLEIFLRDPR
jgi:hypothetical protein